MFPIVCCILITVNAPLHTLRLSRSPSIMSLKSLASKLPSEIKFFLNSGMCRTSHNVLTPPYHPKKFSPVSFQQQNTLCRYLYRHCQNFLTYMERTTPYWESYGKNIQNQELMPLSTNYMNQREHLPHCNRHLPQCGSLNRQSLPHVLSEMFLH